VALVLEICHFTAAAKFVGEAGPLDVVIDDVAVPWNVMTLAPGRA